MAGRRTLKFTKLQTLALQLEKKDGKTSVWVAIYKTYNKNT